MAIVHPVATVLQQSPPCCCCNTQARGTTWVLTCPADMQHYIDCCNMLAARCLFLFLARTLTWQAQSYVHSGHAHAKIIQGAVETRCCQWCGDKMLSMVWNTSKNSAWRGLMQSTHRSMAPNDPVQHNSRLACSLQLHSPQLSINTPQTHTASRHFALTQDEESVLTQALAKMGTKLTATDADTYNRQPIHTNDTHAGTVSSETDCSTIRLCHLSSSSLVGL